MRFSTVALLLIALPVAAYAAVCAEPEQLSLEHDIVFCSRRGGRCNNAGRICCPPFRCIGGGAGGVCTDSPHLPLTIADRQDSDIRYAFKSAYVVGLNEM